MSFTNLLRVSLWLLLHISFFLFIPVALIQILALKNFLLFSYNFLPFLFVLMLLSNLICIQITSPGGTPIRGKNAEMCLQLSRHSISCLPCPFSSGVSHLQLLLSALTLPALLLICTLPLVCLFWLVFSVISCRLIHRDFALLKGGYSTESLQTGKWSLDSATEGLTSPADPASLWTFRAVVASEVLCLGGFRWIALV